MNLMAKALTFGTAGIVAVAAGWFFHVYKTTDNQSITYSVELKPRNDGTLEVKKDNQCTKKPHKGCLLFEEDKIGVIKFYLTGSRIKSGKCPKADAVITKVELTATVDSSIADEAKGDFTVFPIDPWLKNDAFADVDLDDGIVYEAAASIARTQAWIVNLNSHDADDGEKQFWYKVTATACGDSPRTWVIDPRGDNKGSND